MKRPLSPWEAATLAAGCETVSKSEVLQLAAEAGGFGRWEGVVVMDAAGSTVEEHDWVNAGYPTDIPDTLQVCCAKCGALAVEFFLRGEVLQETRDGFSEPPACSGYDGPLSGK